MHARLLLGCGLLFGATSCFSGGGGSENAEDTMATEAEGDGDPGDGDGDPNMTEGTDTANDGSDMCEAGDLCVDEAIAGWDGPVAIYVGPSDSPPPNCDGSFPVKIAEARTDLQTNMGPDLCGCECGPITDAECGPVTLQSSSSPGCFQTNGTWMIDPGECLDLGNPLAGYRYKLSQPDLLSATCTPSTTGDIVPAIHDSQIVACAIDSMAQGCGDSGVCMPPVAAPFDGRVCIVAEGDVQCPNGVYDQRNIYYMGVDDTRSCGACSCDAPPGAKCSGKVNLLSNGCGIQGFKLGEVLTGETCSALVNDGVEFGSFALDPPEDSASCAPSGGGVQGDVQETGAITICCQ